MLKEYMLSLGYTDKEINKILKVYSLLNVKEDTLFKKIKEIFEFLIDNKYTKKQIIKMTKLHPQLFGYSTKGMQKKIDDMIKLGYDFSLVRKMTVSCPQIYSITIENIEQKMNEIMELGYTREQVVAMLKNFPSIYTLTIENMKQKINVLLLLGYNLEQVIVMTINFPQIYSLSIEKIREKIFFYEFIGISEILLKKAKVLIQSVDLSYARYMFYQSIGIDITISNYDRLFLSEKNFKKYYQKNNRQLMELYKYDKDKINEK